MKGKVFRIILPLIFISSVSYSCSQETPPTVTKPVRDSQPVLQVGTEVDAKFIESFEPKPKAGTKITYISTSPGNQPRELSTEIVAVEGEILTVRVTDPDGTKELKGKNADFKDDLPETGIKYQGIEDIKVPAGEYKGTTKVSFTNNQGTKVILWLVKNIGPIKRVDTLANAMVITTELLLLLQP